MRDGRGRCRWVLVTAALALPGLSGPVAPARAAADALPRVDAPSIHSASPDVADGIGPAPGLAFAWDEVRPGGPNDRAVTCAVSEGAFLRTRTPGAPARVLASVTLGGPLQDIDVRRAARAGRFSDHVTTSLRLLLGERAGVRAALALVADDLATGFGLDRYGASVLLERPGALTALAAAGYRIRERYKAPERHAEVPLALGLRARLPWPARGPLLLGVSGGVLLRNDADPPIGQASVRIDLPVARGFWLSLAGRTDSHPEMPGLVRSRAVLSLAWASGPRAGPR